jgi:rhomboid protease GluP
MGVVWVRYRSAAHTPVTYVIIAVNILWFLGVELPRGLGAYGLVASGACAPVLVTSGDWYRLLSAMFVHASPTHIVLNMISLWSLRMVEVWFGSAKYFVTYWLSGFIGFLLSTAITSPMTVSAGASGAIFGVFGAVLYMALRGILTKNVRNQLIFILALNLVYDVVTPSVSLAGHVGGLVTGVMCAALFVQRARMRWVNVIAICCGILTAVALAFAYFG